MVDVALVKEAEDARIWEELNADDPRRDTAIAYLRHAVQALEKVEDFLQSAADAVEDTPETDRIASLNKTAEDLEVDIRMQIGRL